MFVPGLPSILYSLRGLTYFEILVDGPNGDLHSGAYGGAVHHPANALARIVASLQDELGDGVALLDAPLDELRSRRAECEEAAAARDDLSRELATIALDAPVDAKLPTLKWSGPD